MCATFPLTCRAASSSFSGHRRRRPLLLLIVPIVVLSMATDFANGMGCASSKDQASSSPARHSNAGAGGGRAGGRRRPIAVSNLRDVQETDNVWHICLGHCRQFNNNKNMCNPTRNIIHMEGKQCRCKMPWHDRRQCVPYSYPEPNPEDITSGY